MTHVERSLPPFVRKVIPYTYGKNNGYYGKSWMDDYSDYMADDTKEAPTKNQIKPKGDSNEPFIITEVNFPTENYLVAYGITQSGQHIQVNFGPSKLREAKDKVVGRGKLSGYYTSNNIYKYAYNRGSNLPELFVHWTSVNWVKAKPDYEVIELPDSKGFTIKTKKKKDEEEKLFNVDENYARWFDEAIFLNESSYLEKVACGCSNCSQIPTWLEKDELLWFDRTTFVCGPCQEIDFVQDLISQHKDRKNKVA
jgi:hypothetical protein